VEITKRGRTYSHIDDGLPQPACKRTRTSYGKGSGSATQDSSALPTNEGTQVGKKKEKSIN